MNRKTFEQIWRSVDDDSAAYGLRTLEGMSRSSDARTRLQALFIMRKQIAHGEPPEKYLDLAQQLVSDTDNDCRWQALIVIGELTETKPEPVWHVIKEFGQSSDRDMRTGVATVLLEHLLEHHFDIYFPQLKQEIDGGAELLADTLSKCSAFGEAKSHSSEIKALIKRSKAKNNGD